MNVLTYTRSCFGKCKSDSIGMTCGQHGGTLKSKATKYSPDQMGHPVHNAYQVLGSDLLSDQKYLGCQEVSGLVIKLELSSLEISMVF